MISTSSCRTHRSRTPRPSQTFLEDNSSTSKNTIYSPFEIKSESDFDEYDQILSENSFPKNSKSDSIENIQATHPSSYTNTSISRPIMIQEPVINSNARSFFQPPILAQSPKSNDFLNEGDGDFEFYPNEDEFYPTDSFVANTKNNGSSLFCFSEDDDDFDKRNGLDKPSFIKEPSFINEPTEKEKSNRKSNYIVNRKDGTNLNNSFDEFDLKCKNSPEVNNNSVKLINSKIFNFEFEDSTDENSTNSNDKNLNVGLSNKFGQTRLLKFSDQNNYPVSFEPTNIDSLNNDEENKENNHTNENDNPSPFNELPKPFLPASVSPSNFLLEFQKHEAEENLRKARIEWDERIEKQKEISRTKFAELHEKQKMESAPFGSRKSSKNSTSPQRLELISMSSDIEQPVFRVRTVPSVNITKAISEYDKFSKANNLDNAPADFECNDYEYANGYNNKDIFSPSKFTNVNKKPRSAIPPSTNSIASPRTIQTPRQMPKTPDPNSPSKDPKRKTIFKATSDIPGMTAYKKQRTNATLIPASNTVTNNNNNNYSYMSMMSNEDVKREKKLLEDRHKQEVLALNAECTASIKALEDKRDADIAMKENQLHSIVEKIELQRRREEIENRLKKENSDFDIKVKNKNSATPDNYKQGRIDFNRTGRIYKKQQTIDDLQKQMMPYGGKD